MSTKTPRNTARSWLAIGAVFVVLAAACSDDDAATTTQAPPPATTATPPATTGPSDTPTPTPTSPPATDPPPVASQPPAPEPIEKVLTMALSGVPTNVDQAVIQGRPSLVAAQGVVSVLLRYTQEPSPGLSLHSPQDLQGELAESWELNDDGSYTFTLRAAQSPAGNTVTSADVKWSFDRMIALDGIARFLMFVSSIDQADPITIIDDRTFTLNVTMPNTLTLPVLTYYALGIIDSVTATDNAAADDEWAAEWLSGNSASFGAYQYDGITPGEEVRLLKNPNY